MPSPFGGWIAKRHELAHLAVALKALPENKTKSLEDLAQEACRFLLYCQNVLEDVDSNYSKWHLPQNREAQKKLSKPEAARLVTGQKRRDRAVAWFDRFHAFLSYPNEISDESTRKERVPLWDYYEKSGSWPEWYLDWLKGLFAQWRKHEESRSQSERKKISKNPLASSNSEPSPTKHGLLAKKREPLAAKRGPRAVKP